MHAWRRVGVLAVVGAFGVASGCATSKYPASVDSGLSHLMEQGQNAYQAGELDRAASAYDAAVKRAELIDSPGGLALNTYNLAATVLASGNVARAGALLNEALAACGGKGDVAVNARLMQARIAQAAGRIDDAIALTRAAIESPAETPRPGSQAGSHLLMAELLCQQGGLPAAEMELSVAESLIPADSPASLRAESEKGRGRLMEAKGMNAEAAGRFDRCAELSRQAAQYREMALALTSAGGAYSKASMYEKAADRHLRAARSMYAAGDLAGARQAAVLARRAAETAGSRDYSVLVDGLLSRLGKP